MKEQLAAFIIKHGFATGHGDTFEDLLKELDWQINDQAKNANRYIWMRNNISADMEWYLFGKHGHGVIGINEAIDAAMLRDAKGNNIVGVHANNIVNGG